MARLNIDVFLKAGVERIVVASAGCGSTMKEYGDLLKEDPAYAGKAESFGRLTVDITEFLADLPLDPPKVELKARVTYQDPCHLVHAQRITKAPRTLLKAVPGLELVEMENASQCCGAAGIYSITQREMSARLLESKMRWVAAAGANTVATANPGCVIQLEIGLKQAGINGRVCHVVDILDQAYQAEDG
jgi:glycolate oxidase iron-sulfur subunit